MARLWYDNVGKVIALAKTDDEELLFGAGPAGAAGSIQFDEATNAAVLDALDGKTAGVQWQDHTVVGGILKRKGVTVTIAADSAPTADRKFAKTNATTILTALRAGTATTAQVQRSLAYLLYRQLQG